MGWLKGLSQTDGGLEHLITVKQKRQAVLLIAAALTAVLLFAGWLPQMKLSPGIPLPGGSGNLSTESSTSEGSQPFSSGTTWIQGVTVLVLLGLSIYMGISMTRKVPYIKLLQGGVAALLFWTVLIFLPTLEPSQPLEPPWDEPVFAATPSLVYEATELGSPPANFVRSTGAILLALALLTAIWLIRQSVRYPEVSVKLRNSAGNALAALYDGQDMKNVIIRCYLQMQQELANQQGQEPKAWLTPREFQHQMVALGLPAEPTRQLTHLFEEVRYGHKPTGPEEERLAIQCLSELFQPKHWES